MVDIQNSKITQLAADRSNWENYRDRMVLIIKSHKWKDCLTNDLPTKRYINSSTIGGVTPLKWWEEDEAVLMNLIVSSIPDLTFNKIKDKSSVKEVWEALKDLHEKRSPMVVIELQWCIGNIRCRDNENLHTHLENLQVMKEKLAPLGSNIPELEFAYILLWSLPPSYQGIISAINASADFAKATITPVSITQLALDEYNCLQGDKLKLDMDEAFGVSPQVRRPKWRGKRSNIECYNCKKHRHTKVECWAKGGGQEGQWPQRGGTSTNNVTTVAKTNDIEAWAAIEELPDCSVATANVPWNVPINTELYDSGASTHMSPFREKFTMYQGIPPCVIITADKRIFHTTGIGDLRIEVPHRESSTSVILQEVLHAPDMAMTIVSISCITKLRNSVTFEKDLCTIKNV
jgi:gag-polypeptide of LTR copia-type